MYLRKLPSGDYRPIYQSDMDESSKVAVGGDVKATRARNYEFHKKAMALVKMAYDNSDHKNSFDWFRNRLTEAVGYYEEGVDKDGTVKKYAKSWSYDSMTQTEIEELYNKILDYLCEKWTASRQDLVQQLEEYM